MAIISILLSVGINWTINYIFAQKVEATTHKVYAALKSIQLEAKRKKQEFCIDADGELYIYNDSCGTDLYKKYVFELPVIDNNNINLNRLGIFTSQGSIFIKDPETGEKLNCRTENQNIAFCCVKVSQTRVCEGKSDGSDCYCRY